MAVLVAATLTASCATAPPQSSPPPGAAATAAAAAEQLSSNELLANSVYRRLNADPVYYYRHVEVTVDHGIARLSGYVWSTDALYSARRIAQSVPGITGVVTTQLELERNGRNSGVTR